ncbi:hypothetical protein N665_0774s0012 [Sinapis alba]|nr:hypothetical protein N665_0774s0012 [Sinapis alba]
MGSFKSMFIFTLVAMTFISCDRLFGIFNARHYPANCGKEDKECVPDRFWDTECNGYCQFSHFKSGKCIISDGFVGLKPPQYSCCCGN